MEELAELHARMQSIRDDMRRIDDEIRRRMQREELTRSETKDLLDELANLLGISHTDTIMLQMIRS